MCKSKMETQVHKMPEEDPRCFLPHEMLTVPRGLTGHTPAPGVLSPMSVSCCDSITLLYLQKLFSHTFYSQQNEPTH